MRRRRKSKAVLVTPMALAVTLAVVGGCVFQLVLHRTVEPEKKRPDILLMEYMQYIAGGNYEVMYGILDGQSHLNISLGDFIGKNKKTYEGIEAPNIRIEIIGTEQRGDGTKTMNYQTTMDTMAGEVNFFNRVDFYKEGIIPITDGTESGRGSKKRNRKVDTEYKVSWSDQVIFPRLMRTNKVRVHTNKAPRGRVLNRNGNFLIGEGTASLMGLVSGKMNWDGQSEHGYLEEDIQHLSVLLRVSKESIIKKLSTDWVKDDSLVPLKILEKVNELGSKSESPDEGDLQSRAVQGELLTILEIVIMDTTMRGYPSEEEAAYLMGHVQNVTAGDLGKYQREDYLTDSVVGRSGMEELYETELKGQSGTRTTIVTADGTEKLILASAVRNDDQDTRLIIGSQLRSLIYDIFKDRKSCTIAINPLMEEVLTLVNTPGYDNNDLILGLSEGKWASFNEDERNPMLNRFRQHFVLGSSSRPVTGVIDLTSGVLNPSGSFNETVAPMS